MADERAGAQEPPRNPAGKDALQSSGRKANAAQPLNAGKDHGGPERDPAVDQTDGVHSETRTFNPAPRQGAGDTSPVATNEGRLGPGADPAEGKDED